MRVALLMNFIAPYRVPLLEALRDRAGELRVLLSTAMERDRSWVPDWGTLDVVVQRSVSVRRTYSDAFGFKKVHEVHVPYDTMAQLVRYRPDAVVSGELGVRSLQAALYKLMRPKVPFLIWATLSELSERNWGTMRHRLRRFILGRADGVYVNGESGARYIATFGVPERRIFRLNQPVDVSMFAAEPRQRPDHALTRLLYVGMLNERKGLSLFARQLADWAAAHPDRPLEVWWVGEGPLEGMLRNFAFPPSVSQRVWGPVPYAALPAIYAQADLFVFPSLMDEWGLVVNEAMASGMPVLGSIHSQAVEELVTEGVTGWVFDPRSDSSHAAALARALDTPPERLAGMREAARRRVMALTPAATAERMERAIREIMADRSQERVAPGTRAPQLGSD